MKKTLYREALTAEEINAHKNDYTNETPAIYVGTYAKYNEGSLFGMWIDLSTFDDADELYDFCVRLHADEYDPELMVQDFECFPRRFYCESFSLKTFESLFEFMQLDEDDREMCAEFWDEIDDSETDCQKIIDACVYRGNFDDYADELADEMMACHGQTDSIIARYFDYAAWRRDLAYDYNVTSNYVFDTRI